MTRLLIAAVFVALAACSPPGSAPQSEEAPATPELVTTDAPAGAYRLDPGHSSLLLRVNHMSMSNFTARFVNWDARLQLDPANPGAATVSATIDPRSFTSDNPPPGLMEVVHGPGWLDVAQFPAISFQSTAVEVTGANTARITGDFSMRGVTRPVMLDATFNGGYAGHPQEQMARIGFSARGTLKRSEFGIDVGIPAPGSTMGVSDDVEIIIEAELTGPPWTPPTAQ